MLLIDEDDWPLVLVRREAPTGALDIDLYRSRFQGWLRRETPFVVLGFQPPPTPELIADPIHTPAWTAGLRDQVRRRCAGFACVISDARVPEALMLRHGMSLQRLLGCPVQVFFDSDEGLRWARQQLKDFVPPPAVAAAARTGVHTGRAVSRFE